MVYNSPSIRIYSGNFQALWNGTRYGPPSDSNRRNYEYAIAHRAVLRRFSKAEVVALIHCWWHRHKIVPDHSSLSARTIPNVLEFTAEVREQRRIRELEPKREAKRRYRELKKAARPPNTRQRVIGLIRREGFTCLKDLAARLNIEYGAAVKQVQRLRARGILIERNGLLEVV